MPPSLRLGARPWIIDDVDPHVPEIPNIPRRYCHAAQGTPGAPSLADPRERSALLELREVGISLDGTVCILYE